MALQKKGEAQQRAQIQALLWAKSRHLPLGELIPAPPLRYHLCSQDQVAVFSQYDRDCGVPPYIHYLFLFSWQNPNFIQSVNQLKKPKKQTKQQQKTAHISQPFLKLGWEMSCVTWSCDTILANEMSVEVTGLLRRCCWLHWQTQLFVLGPSSPVSQESGGDGSNLSRRYVSMRMDPHPRNSQVESWRNLRPWC